MNGVTVPIVTYHGIGSSASSVSIRQERFERQLTALVSRGYRSVTLSDVLNWLGNGTALPDQALVITFDDGYQSVFTQALPRLKAHGLVATVFVITAYMGKSNRWPSQRESVPDQPLLTWGELSSLVAEGWEVGAHTQTHPLLTGLSPAAAEREIVGAKEDLETHTGADVRTFAYPYGASNAQVESIVRRHFAGAVGSDLGLAGTRSDPFLLPRIDAYYLRPGLIPTIERPIFRGYLKLRQLLRSMRRRVQPDWETSIRPHSAYG